MTLTQVQAIEALAQSARQMAFNLQDQMTRAITSRDASGEAFFAKSQLAVNGVLADPIDGRESSSHETIGYTRKCERKSGLTRKGAVGPTPKA